MVPLLMILILYGKFSWAFGLFLLAGITDMLDGYLARRLDQCTLFGLYLDPAADKVLTVSSYLVLGFSGHVPAWLSVIVVFKEVFMILGATIIFVCGWEMKVEPSRWGKQTTFFQLFAVALALLAAAMEWTVPWIVWLFGVTGLLTVFCGSHYIWSRLRSLPADAVVRVDSGSATLPTGNK